MTSRTGLLIAGVVGSLALAHPTYALNWITLVYPPTNDTYVQGVDGGMIVGYYTNDATPNTINGFTYNQGTAAWTTLNYPAANDTYVLGISGKKIVGHTESGKSFLYDSGVFTTLPNMPGASNGTYASGISPATSGGYNIVGTYITASFAQGSYLYNTVSNSWTDLRYPGAVYTLINGISGNTFFGSYSVTGVERHGYVSNGSSWTSFDYPEAGVSQTFVDGVSGNNIFGTYYDAHFVQHGFLYDGQKWTTLNYPDQSAATTTINDVSGNLVVGAYGDGQNHVLGFLLDMSPVPEPASLGLLGIGAMGLLLRRRRI